MNALLRISDHGLAPEVQLSEGIVCLRQGFSFRSCRARGAIRW